MDKKENGVLYIRLGPQPSDVEHPVQTDGR